MLSRFALLFAATAFAVTSVGCTATDTVSDAPDGQAETPDSGQPGDDAGPEAGPDAGPEAGPEAGQEAGQDAAQEAAADAMVEPDAAPSTHLIATITTSMGTIQVELAAVEAPVTTDNFQKYADASYYDGLLFHRVIPDFMIQGGGLEPGLKSRATLYPPIVNEAATSGLSNLRGTIAMARTSAPNSATSQFFINTVDNTFLDAAGSSAGYAVFGHVVAGMDVVDNIVAVPTHTVGGYDDVPVDDVLIESISVAEVVQ